MLLNIAQLIKGYFRSRIRPATSKCVFKRSDKTSWIYYRYYENWDKQTRNIWHKNRIQWKKYKVKLEIRDTLAPEAEIKNIDLYEGRVIEPQEFIKGINDATNVTVDYKTTPDFNKIGTQDVTLLLEDEAGNKSEYQAKLRVSKTKENIKVDISNRVYTVEAFLKEKNDLAGASIIEPLIVPEKMGIYPAKIKIDDIIYESNIVVTDLTLQKEILQISKYGKMIKSTPPNLLPIFRM